MGWLTYYHLLEKYNGELSKATKEEMDFAYRDNPNTSPEARALAEKKWEENNLRKASKVNKAMSKAFFGN